MSTRPVKTRYHKLQQQRRRNVLVVAIAATVTAGLTTVADAAQFIYTPAGTTDQWSGGVNWSATPLSAADTQLTMVGSNATVIPDGQVSTANNDNVGNFLLNILDLQGTGPATTDAAINITGNTLEFVSSAGLPVVNLNANDGAADLDYGVSNAIVLTNNTTLAGNGTSAFAFTGSISGTGSLTKTGASFAVLSAGNTYTGGTTISGGVLRATQTASLPGYNAAGQVIVNSGGTLSVTAGGAGEWTESDVDALRINATFDGGSILGINVDTGNTFTYNSSIADPSVTASISLTKSGSGMLVLTGTNTYTGTTDVAAGTLQSSAAASLPGYDTAGRVTVTGTLRLLAGSGAWTSSELDNAIANVTFNTGSTLNVDVSDTAAIAANITQPVALTKSGTGTLTLTGTNTYSGATSLHNGTLAINNGTQLGSGSLNLGNTSGAPTLQVNAASATITNPTILMDGNGTFPVAVSSAGTVEFTGNLKATEANAVININSTGLTTFSGPFDTSDNSSSRTIRIGGSGNVLISGVVSNGAGGATAGSVGYTGSGKLTFTGANTHSGTTFVTNGTVSITNGSQLGTSRLQWGDGATVASPILEVTGAGPLTISNNIFVRAGITAGGILSAATPINFTGIMSANTGTGLLLINNTSPTTFSGSVAISDGSSNRTLRLGGSGNILISAPIINAASGGSGIGSLAYFGAGILTLSGANTYTGTTTLNNGAISISAGNAFGTSRVDLGSNGTGSGATTLAVTGAGPINIANQTWIRGVAATPITLAGATPVSFSGLFSAATGNALINVDNSALTTLAGTLQLSNDGSNRTLRFGGSGNVLVSGNVTNSTGAGVGSLIYEGTGTMTISGNMSHTGTTTASSGKLLLNNSLTTSSSITASGSGTIELGANGNRIIATNGVTVSGSGKIDLKDNKLLVRNGAGALTTLTGYVTTARSGGTWAGPSGITSSLAAVSPGDLLYTVGIGTAGNARGITGTQTASFGGQTVTENDVLVRYTYLGDATLDGVINGDDFAKIDAGFSASSTGYVNGDFNYSGSIDADDYWLIDRNYSRNLSALAPSAPVGGVTAVPEPAGLVVLAFSALGLTRRRRSGRL